MTTTDKQITDHGERLAVAYAEDPCRRTWSLGKIIYNAHIAGFSAGREALGEENARLRIALEKIAGQDYRGNRSAEMQIAWEALKGNS